MAAELLAFSTKQHLYTMGGGRAAGADLKPSGTYVRAEAGAGARFWASLSHTDARSYRQLSPSARFADHLRPLADKCQLWS